VVEEPDSSEFSWSHIDAIIERLSDHRVGPLLSRHDNVSIALSSR
jgi:hypothetical protein